MDPLTVFAANVRRLRVDRGLTQEQLAERSGLHLTDIGRIERARRDPGVRVAAKVARGLDVDLSMLYENVPTGPARKRAG